MADQPQSVVRNGASARAGRDDVLADLLKMGDNVELPKLGAVEDVDTDDPRKVDDHGRPVRGKAEPEDDDIDERDEDESADEDEDLEDVADRDDEDEDEADLDEDEEDEDEKPARRSEKEDEEKDADEDDKAQRKDEKERPKEDPELERRRRVIQQQERRHRETVARDRAALERDAAEARRRIETEWGPRVAKAEKFEKLAERVRFDTPTVLVELGLQPDDFEPVARMLYAMSPAGAAKPENREAAARLAREREQHTETSSIKAELAEVKKQLAARDEQDQRARLLDEWRGELTDAAKVANTPLVRRVLERRPAKAHQEMEALAHRLMQKDGRVPSAKRVVLAYEKQRRRDLEDAGANIDDLLKADTKKPANDAAKVQPDEKRDEKRDAAPAKKAKPKTRDQIRDELEAELNEQERRQRMTAH